MHIDFPKKDKNFLMALKVDCFQLINRHKEKDIKISNCKQLKTLTPEQMLQRLPIALTQVKSGNTAESLLNKIRQTIYCFYRTKKISKIVYNNIMISIKL